MNKDTVKDLTLMLMYLTSWEERLIPGIRKKPDRAGIYPKARICWKGYNFDVLNELTDDGLVNAGGRSKSASFTDEGEAKALELLRILAAHERWFSDFFQLLRLKPRKPMA